MIRKLADMVAIERWWKITGLVLWFLLLFPACDSVGESQSAPDGSERLWNRHVLTLKDFWDDPSLSADPRNLVAVAFRQTPPWVNLPESRDGAPVAVIPYHLDRTADIGFRWDDPAGETSDFAVLKNGSGVRLWTLESDGREIRSILASGRYSLEIFRDSPTDKRPVYIQPRPDIDQPLFDPDQTPYPEQLVFHTGDCPACNLSGGNLFQAVMADGALPRANLSGANLFQAGLAGSFLAAANLDGGNLFQGDLAGADLTGASLGGTNAFQADFTGALLSGADMQGINAPEACFVDAKLDRSHVFGSVLGYINAANADFSEAHLKGAILIYADLTDVTFRAADLSEADLTGAVIHGADFTRANLTDAVWIDGSRCGGRSVDTCR
jgi:uncharacterized protein YjbI with pentapeptide repeats